MPRKISYSTNIYFPATVHEAQCFHQMFLLKEIHTGAVSPTTA
jgi:hypothetical protein